MKTDYTHITLVVDRSGSMANIAADAQGGVNSFVAEQKALAGEATFFLVQFDGEIDDVFGPADIQDFGIYNLWPRGSTALLDAIGRGIVKTGEYLAAMPEADRPEKVVFCIVTDGEENSSSEWTQAGIKARVEEQTNAYNWQFVFIGANIDAFAVGTSYGVTTNAGYVANRGSTQSIYRGMTQTVSSYRTDAGATSVGPIASVDADGNEIA